jgi:hypothetical protein
MKAVRLVTLMLSAGLFLALVPAAARAKSITVHAGDDIQTAVDAAAAGDTVKVEVGEYMYVPAGTVSAAVRITKPLKLLAKSNFKKNERVVIKPGPGQQHGILVEPPTPGDPDIIGVTIKGFTVQGFSNNGIWLRHVQKFKILGNESINNLENGIWPTLSANGTVKKNVSYGSLDSALWIEASENVRVLKNDLPQPDRPGDHGLQQYLGEEERNPSQHRRGWLVPSQRGGTTAAGAHGRLADRKEQHPRQQRDQHGADWINVRRPAVGDWRPRLGCRPRDGAEEHGHGPRLHRHRRGRLLRRSRQHPLRLRHQPTNR